MAAEPRDASSLILLRSGPSGESMEVLMVRRSSRGGFAGGMHVFPGGSVEPFDCEGRVAGLCEGVSSETALSVIGDAPSPGRAMGLYVAGVRETFEETGIMLARTAAGEIVSCRGEMADKLASFRDEMAAGRLSFDDIIAREGLKLALDSLVYFAQWITPEVSPVRFDNRFFLAQAPDCQEALHDDIETTCHGWVSPG